MEVILQQITNRCVGEWSYYLGCCTNNTPKYICVYNELINVLTIPEYIGGWLSLSYLSLTLGLVYLVIESYNMAEFKEKYESIELTVNNRIVYAGFLIIGLYGVGFGVYGITQGLDGLGAMNMLLGFVYLTGLYDIWNNIRELNG